MRKLILLSFVFWSIVQLKAQNIPDFVNFQGIARDTAGNVISNSFIQVRFSIIDSNETTSDKVIYKEYHVKKTDLFGQFNAVLNESSTVEVSKYNSLNLIPWHTGKKSVKIEYKPSIGDAYIPLGTIRCNSVWYSFASKTSENLVGVNLTGAVDGQLLKYNGTSKTWNPAVDNGVPAGTVISYAGNALPDGWLLCDGSVKKQSDYPNLYAAIGTIWGNGNGSAGSFNLPELRGMFLRGWSDLTPLFNDPDNNTRTANKPGGATGNNVGSIQGDAFQGHAHSTLSVWTGAAASGQLGLAGGTGVYVTPSTITSGGPVLDGPYGTPNVKSETRPKNAYIMYIIKK